MVSCQPRVFLNVARLLSSNLHPLDPRGFPAVSGYVRKHANTIGHSVVGDSQKMPGWVDFKGQKVSISCTDLPSETWDFGIYITLIWYIYIIYLYISFATFLWPKEKVKGPLTQLEPKTRSVLWPWAVGVILSSQSDTAMSCPTGPK